MAVTARAGSLAPSAALAATMTPPIAAPPAATPMPTAAVPAAALPAAVCAPIAALIAGPLTPATVLGVHRAAVILAVESPESAAAISVLAAEASGVPNGIRTALRATDLPFAHFKPHDAAFVGGGRVQLPGLTLRAVRTIRTAVPHLSITPETAMRLASHIDTSIYDEPRGVSPEPVAELRSALDSGDPTALRGAVRALVGLGSGSTPGGDDVLCGAMAALRATGRAVLADQIAAAALPGCQERTPLLSATLLQLAAAGQVCAEAAAVLSAAGRAVGLAAARATGHAAGHAAGRATGHAAGRTTSAATGVARRGAAQGVVISGDAAATTAELDRALAALVAIGHTSGADLATGIAAGLAVADQPEPRRPRSRSRSAA